ncbi:MAG: gluconokinase [Thermomicrobiales bacterium]
MSDSRSSGEKFVLAIDIGSSSVRAMVYDQQGLAVDGLAAQLALELETTADGGVTLDADVLLQLVEACIDAVSGALEFRLPIDAVGISSFWHSLIGLDDSGKAVTPIYHLADSRSADVVDEMRKMHDQEIWKAISGTLFHSSYWPAKLIWVRRTAPAVFERVARWTSGADYVLRKLTGADVSSICMASGTGMLDISRCEWSSDFAALAGVTLASLPPLVDRHEHFHLGEGYAERWPSLSNVPWFAPLGDGACANLGCGAVEPDRLALTLGTTGAVRVLVKSPAGEFVHPVDGLWAYRLDRQTVIRGAAITNGGIWGDFLLEMFGVDESMYDTAFELPPAEHGLTILPFLAGERAPIWNDRARAVIAGLHPETTPLDIMRAGLEAVGHRMRLIYDLMAPVVSAEHVIVANGAALLRSRGWQQILASDLDHAIVILPVDLEASARGAAMSALQGVGAISDFTDVQDLSEGATVVFPVPEEAARYDHERARQERLRSRLYPAGSSWDSD